MGAKVGPFAEEDILGGGGGRGEGVAAGGVVASTQVGLVDLLVEPGDDLPQAMRGPDISSVRSTLPLGTIPYTPLPPTYLLVRFDQTVALLQLGLGLAQLLLHLLHGVSQGLVLTS